MNILIVDDNEMMRSVLRVILSSYGHTILGEADNCQKGLELTLALRPQIVCLDILMHDGSGVEVLKQIVKVLPKTIVLMVTGKSDTETVNECLKEKARGFIIKPFNANDVLKVVNEAVRHAALT